MIKINLNKSSLINADCLEAMRSMPDNCVDSVITDAPYGLSFMGKKWDYDVPSSEIFKEILRVLKPGGHMLCACGTRTQHRMAVNIEDAGFEIRDVISWIYGSGFPKSMDISKAIDKQAGAEREVIGEKLVGNAKSGNKSWKDNHEAGTSGGTHIEPITAPKTDAAKQWQGWGTALKPACEFWTLARKPLSEKTVAANVLEHGTGGINIDGCRVGDEILPAQKAGQAQIGTFERKDMFTPERQGRWPANLILSEEAAELLDEQSGILKSGARKESIKKESGVTFQAGGVSPCEASQGGASRFFYVAKASKSERNSGLDEMPLQEKRSAGGTTSSGKPTMEGRDRFGSIQQNTHPTVKPIKLMTYLVRLITPPNGTVLDPFAGSFSTGVAAIKEGFGFIGIERDPDYFKIGEARLSHAQSEGDKSSKD